jgi:hypothetical protein
MELEGSLLHSQAPAICPCTKPQKCSQCLPIPLLKHSCIIIIIIIIISLFPSTPRSCKWLLSLRSPHQNPVRTSLVSHTCHIPRPSHIIYLITRIIFREEYRSWSSSSCSLLHSRYIIPLGPKIFFSTIFSNILSLCPSLRVRNPVLHVYKTTDKIIVLYILIFLLLDSILEDKGSCTK